MVYHHDVINIAQNTRIIINTILILGFKPKIRVCQTWLVSQSGHTFTKMRAESSSTGFQAIKGPANNDLLAFNIAMLRSQVSPYLLLNRGSDIGIYNISIIHLQVI